MFSYCPFRNTSTIFHILCNTTATIALYLNERKLKCKYNPSYPKLNCITNTHLIQIGNIYLVICKYTSLTLKTTQKPVCLFQDICKRFCELNNFEVVQDRSSNHVQGKLKCLRE